MKSLFLARLTMILSGVGMVRLTASLPPNHTERSAMARWARILFLIIDIILSFALFFIAKA